MKRNYVLSLLIALLMLPVTMQAQSSCEEEIIVKSHDGDIVIAPMSIRLKDYVLIPVKWEKGVIYLEDEFANATAMLDLRKNACFCLRIQEGNQTMQVACDWSDIHIPDHSDIWARLTENDRSFFSRTAIQRSLIAGIPR